MLDMLVSCTFFSNYYNAFFTFHDKSKYFSFNLHLTLPICTIASIDRGHIVFSSPEHNMLRGSYCDRSSSGVRPSICPSVNNFFKNLLLQNQKANLDKTWQECSLGEALQKLLKEFNSNKNSGCHGNKMEKIFKNLLVTNHKAGSIHILYEASLGDPLPKLLKLFPWGHIRALPGHTLFYIETKKESFQKSSSDKP